MKTPCQEFEPDIALLAIGSLGDDSAVQAHLKTCLGCRHLLQDYEEISRLLKKPAEANEIQTALLHKKVIDRLRKPGLRKLYAIAALLGLVFGLALLHYTSRTVPPTPTAQADPEPFLFAAKEPPERTVPSMLFYRYAMNKSIEALEERLVQDARIFLKPDPKLIAQAQQRRLL